MRPPCRLATAVVTILLAASTLVGSLPAQATGGGRPSARHGPATYAIGDSVLIDAEGVLQRIVPRMNVNAAVSRQFGDGLAIVQHLRAAHRLPQRFVVFLGTNGYVTTAQFAAMLRNLRSCRRVVVVTLWVPTRAWMRPDNTLLRTGPRRQHNVVVADWTRLARAHPRWFYADHVHLPIDGPGATALARLIAHALA